MGRTRASAPKEQHQKLGHVNKPFDAAIKSSLATGATRVYLVKYRTGARINDKEFKVGVTESFDRLWYVQVVHCSHFIW